MSALDPTALQQKFLGELCDIVREGERFPDAPKLVMMSGGVDSLTLLAVATKLFDRVEALTIAGDTDTQDTLNARKNAEALGVPHTQVRVPLDAIMANLDLARGRGFKTVFNVQFWVTHTLAFQQFDVSGRDILQGDGADALYGSTTSRIYMKSGEIAKTRGVSLDEARTICKQEYLAESLRLGRGTARLFAALADAQGANAIQPFRDERVRWVNDLPYSLSRPDRKQFPRDALALWGVDSSRAHRLSMQQGSGVYDAMKMRLVARAGTKSPNAAVRKLVG